MKKDSVIIDDSDEEEPSDCLGLKDVRVSEEVHDAMIKMCLEGVLPRTTLEQRQMYTKSLNVVYGMPKAFREAFDNGYLHPCLPPPKGLKWRFRGSNCELKIAGG